MPIELICLLIGFAIGLSIGLSFLLHWHVGCGIIVFYVLIAFGIWIGKDL